MNPAKGLAVFSLVLLSLLGASLLLFCCIHYRPAGWANLCIVPVLLVAFVAPAICMGYNSDERVVLEHVDMDANTFQSCRLLGWSVASVLLLFSYAVPRLAWYNSTSFTWHGVVFMDADLTCIVCAFILWLRVFVFA